VEEEDLPVQSRGRDLPQVVSLAACIELGDLAPGIAQVGGGCRLGGIRCSCWGRMVVTLGAYAVVVAAAHVRRSNLVLVLVEVVADDAFQTSLRTLSEFGPGP
jgi:hypothetical protein